MINILEVVINISVALINMPVVMINMRSLVINKTFAVFNIVVAMNNMTKALINILRLVFNKVLWPLFIWLDRTRLALLAFQELLDLEQNFIPQNRVFFHVIQQITVLFPHYR